jgi:hypothetical protein
VKVWKEPWQYLACELWEALADALEGGMHRCIPCVLILWCAKRQSGEWLELVCDELAICCGKRAKDSLVAPGLSHDADGYHCNDTCEDDDDVQDLTRIGTNYSAIKYGTIRPNPAAVPGSAPKNAEFAHQI